jgi:hypothetical protein
LLQTLSTSRLATKYRVEITSKSLMHLHLNSLLNGEFDESRPTKPKFLDSFQIVGALPPSLLFRAALLVPAVFAHFFVLVCAVVAVLVAVALPHGRNAPHPVAAELILGARNVTADAKNVLVGAVLAVVLTVAAEKGKKIKFFTSFSFSSC